MTIATIKRSMNQIVVGDAITQAAPAHHHATEPLATVDGTAGGAARGTRGIHVGGAGNLTCKFAGSSADVVLTALPVGFYPFCLTHIRATGTTATNITCLF